MPDTKPFTADEAREKVSLYTYHATMSESLGLLDAATLQHRFAESWRLYANMLDAQPAPMTSDQFVEPNE